jgi:ribonuclease BN (tRNA processing enzyme)
MRNFLIKSLASSSEGNAHILKIYKEDKLRLTILLDAGIPHARIVQANDFNPINVCFITHKHKDHALSAEKLERMGAKMIQAKEDVNNYSFEGAEITTFQVEHGECLCNGALIEDEEKNGLLYITDFTICKYSFKTRKIKALMIECNYCNDKIQDAVNEGKEKEIRQLNTHMSVENLTKVIPSIVNTEGLEEVYLMHLSDSYSDEDKMIEMIKKIVPETTKIFVCFKWGGVRNGR